MNTKSSEEGQGAAQASEPPPEKQTSLLVDVLATLGVEKRLFLAVATLGTIAALAFALTRDRYYSASTVLLPPQPQPSAAAALSQLGALSSVAGAALGVKTTDEMYVVFLGIRSLQDALVSRFHLMERYHAPTPGEARKALANRVTITLDRKTGLITVGADDTDAKFAAELANAHVDELRKLLSTLAVTEAQQRRMFFEQQVKHASEALRAAELTFRQTQQRSGLVVTQALAESGVKANIELRAQIASREVALEAMSRFATPENPGLQRLSAELTALRSQLIRLEQGDHEKTGSSGFGMEAVQAFRAMKVQEATLDALIRQLEAAKLDESREGPLLQQVDPAQPPEKPTKPNRARLAIMGSLAAVAAGGALALLRTGLRRLRSGRTSPQITRLVDAWLP